MDCRLVVELPEDSVVGVRFMTYAITSAIALAAMLFTGWLAYKDLSLRHMIADAEQREEEDHWDVAEIRRLQRFYEIETKKIEGAYSEMRNPMLISGFVSELGRTLPDRMLVDSIEWADDRVTLRGGLRESSARASHAPRELRGAAARRPRDRPAFHLDHADRPESILRRRTDDGLRDHLPR